MTASVLSSQLDSVGQPIQTLVQRKVQSSTALRSRGRQQHPPTSPTAFQQRQPFQPLAPNDRYIHQTELFSKCTHPGKYWNFIIRIPGLDYTGISSRSWKIPEYEPVAFSCPRHLSWHDERFIIVMISSLIYLVGRPMF